MVMVTKEVVTFRWHSKDIFLIETFFFQSTFFLNYVSVVSINFNSTYSRDRSIELKALERELRTWQVPSTGGRNFRNQV